MASEAKTAAELAATGAAASLSRLEGHERVCTERQGNIISQLKQVQGLLNKCMWAGWAAAGGAAYIILHGKGIL